MKKQKLSFRKKIISFSVIAVLLVFFSGRKIYDYAAAPDHDKDCDYLFPGIADQTKPTTIVASPAEYGLSLIQTGGVINDASCLNKTAVYGIVSVSTIDDITNTLRFARDNNVKVAASGQRHSMGGQSFVKDGLVLDMRRFNHMELDAENRVLTVQAGATWDSIQKFLDPHGLSVKAMQSINIFTVGGTLSVNAHGMDHHAGQIAPTVRSLRIMLSNGEIKTASLTENAELFRNALGGYGLIGIILDVDLDLTENEMYERDIAFIDYEDFAAYYKQNIENNDEYGLFFARLSVAPGSYLREMALHQYKRSPTFTADLPITPLQTDDKSWTHRLIWNISKRGGWGRSLRWWTEKNLESYFHRCVSRNEAMNEKDECLVARNQEMYDTVKNIKTRLPEADILQEYFIPQDQMVAFTDGLRSTVERNGANLLNATVRIVHHDTITALPYAKGERFAFVLYFNQGLNDKESAVLQKTTSDLIDLATSLGGTYYLPYQLVYTPAQLRSAYPEVDSFFTAKKIFDPLELFDNAFYEKYGSASRS